MRVDRGHVRTVVDDCSLVACAEVHDDQTAVTADVLRCAVLWFAAGGVSVEARKASEATGPSLR